MVRSAKVLTSLRPHTKMLSTGITFSNTNIQDLPFDASPTNLPRQVPNAIFCATHPLPVINPRLVAKSQTALDLLNLSTASNEELTEYLSGNAVIPGSIPAAHVYCGHQFGSFSGQLGDGAAMYLGEIISSTTGNKFELQLKGAGPTPCSRNADGRKVLRSSIREFLCSEAMYYLNVPTTRAATCITSDTMITRDPYYDGNAIQERCTVVSRIAPCFFRFGSFEIFKEKDAFTGYSGPSAGNNELKKVLLDHVIKHFPDAMLIADEQARYHEFYRQVVRLTAEMVAHWQSIGFVHGVLNTDNMSILGLTIDYGPFGFMEHFDDDFVPNGSDHSGRYSYGKQPSICKWNLEKLAESLHPVVPIEMTRRILEDNYDTDYTRCYMARMRHKLGFVQELEGDLELINELFAVMETTRADFTDTFRAIFEFLAQCPDKAKPSPADIELLINKITRRCARPEQWALSLQRKRRIHRPSIEPMRIQQLWQLLQTQSEQQLVAMFGSAVNVAGVRKEITGEKKIMDMLMRAYDDIKKIEKLSVADKQAADERVWREWITVKYMPRLAVETMTTAASGDSSAAAAGHSESPAFVLRHWILQDAIAAAEEGDYSKVECLIRMIEQPYCSSYSTFLSDEERTCSPCNQYTRPAPTGSQNQLCTCSS